LRSNRLRFARDNYRPGNYSCQKFSPPMS